MKYTKTHEWIEVTEGLGVVGVTNHAQKELGEIVYVELPQVGKEIKASQEAAVLESTKAAADVYSPVSGVIHEVNEKLRTQPELINHASESDGWIFKIRIKNNVELESLLDQKAYQGQLG